MAYTPTEWKDHIVEHPNRYRVVDNGDGTVDILDEHGEILQQGTPVDASRLNKMEKGIKEAHDLIDAHLNDFASHAHRHAEDGEDPITPEMIGGVPISRTINGKALSGNIVLNHNDVGSINSVSVGTTADPNTTTEPYILTNHPNSPGKGIYWHILTFFYSQRASSSNRSQLAISYNGSTVMMFVRHNYGGTWTPWRELYNDGSHPKITVSSTAPSDKKYGDIWIEP